MTLAELAYELDTPLYCLQRYYPEPEPEPDTAESD